MVWYVDIDSKTVNQKICFVLPTYNEEENIENLIELITQEGHNQSKSVFSILVVDDNSSDQTQDIVKRVIDSANNVYLISGQKKGLGDAYKRGFVFAIDSLEADVIFQMDADGQHDTALIPQFLNAIEEGRDVVIGSRYVAGGSLPDFSMFRLLISKIGN